LEVGAGPEDPAMLAATVHTVMPGTFEFDAERSCH
jgi:hypothetical protein